MDAAVVETLAREQGVKLPDGSAEAAAAVLGPVGARVRETAARTPFEAEPAEILKALRP
jgi:hypothetical protein